MIADDLSIMDELIHVVRNKPGKNDTDDDADEEK